MSETVVWLYGEVRTPPFSANARFETGKLIRLLQEGEILSMPQSRPMSSIAATCHELRVRDEDHNWRVIYCLEVDEVLILEVFD